jgi:hypothetical protein
MDSAKYLKSGITGFAALLFAGAQMVPGAQANGPVLTAASALVHGERARSSDDKSSGILAA